MSNGTWEVASHEGMSELISKYLVPLMAFDRSMKSNNNPPEFQGLSTPQIFRSTLLLDN